MSDEPTTPDEQPAEAPAATPLPSVTPPTEWRRKAKARFMLTLPSGAVVMARRPDWVKLSADGVIDLNELTQLTTATNAEQLSKVLTLFPSIMPHIVVEPRVAPNGTEGDDVLTPDDVAYVDRLALWTWASGAGTNVVEQEVPVH